jgi:hypothetical protein
MTRAEDTRTFFGIEEAINLAHNRHGSAQPID